ncbi:MAG: peptidyl-prolyl cis-trans isomerase [Thermosipho sp. (in: Bacteria)]|nr:peptidyl-prolyl cis-trans isomerase [Thermosipho sp. (in: thermotogales)]
MKKILISLLVLVSIFFVFAEEATTTTLPGTTVVAIVNGEEITLEELNSQANINSLLVNISQIDQTFFDVLTNTEEGVKLLMRYKKAVLEKMVDQLLVVQFAEKFGVRPTQEEVTQYVDKQIADYLSSQGIDEETFNTYLQYANMGTLEDFKKRLYFSTLVNLSINNLFEYVSKNATVTEEEIVNYYNENVDQFSSPSTYDLYVMTFTSETLAKAAKEKVASGVDFESVAKENNLDNFKYENVVEGDVFPEKLWLYIKEALSGALIGPISVDNNYYLVKLLSKNPPQIKPLEEVKEDITNQLLSDKQSEIWSKFIDEEFAKFKENSEVKLLYNVE